MIVIGLCVYKVFKIGVENLEYVKIRVFFFQIINNLIFWMGWR